MTIAPDFTDTPLSALTSLAGRRAVVTGGAKGIGERIAYRLAEAGYEPHVAAPTMRPIKLVVHDFEPGWDTYVERPGYELIADLTFADADPAVGEGLDRRQARHAAERDQVLRAVELVLEVRQEVGAAREVARVGERGVQAHRVFERGRLVDFELGKAKHLTAPGRRWRGSRRAHARA